VKAVDAWDWEFNNNFKFKVLEDEHDEECDEWNAKSTLQLKEVVVSARGWRSFATYGHPGLLSQHQIRYDQIIPRFSPFESEHKPALNIECHEFDELHSL